MSGKTSSGKPEKLEEPEAEAEEPAPAKKPGGKKKLILMAAAAIVPIAIVAGLWFSGILPGLLGMRHDQPKEQEAAKPAVPVFVDLPDMIANLAGVANKDRKSVV